MSRPAETAKVSHTREGRTSFVPTPVDVIVARAMLRKSGALPFELTNRIIEFAEYWPCSHTSITYEEAAIFGRDSNKLLIRTPPVGFTRPPTERYTTDDKIPPAPLSGEVEAHDFEKYLGKLMPSLAHPVRKIVFTIESRDQGWGGGDSRGSYHGSWTWFEAGLERFDPSAPCPDEENDRACGHRPLREPERALPYCKLRPIYPVPTTENGKTTLRHKLLHDHALTIQCNKVADHKPRTHTVTWSWEDNIHPESAAADEIAEKGRGRETGTGEFVRGLRVGDVVSVWVKARFPGWSNHVHRVEVDVYWAV